MKTLMYLIVMALIVMAGCSKDDVLLENQNNLELKNAIVTSVEIAGLIYLFDKMIADNELDGGISVSLLSKFEAAIKRQGKVKDNAAMSQFNAIINQLNDLTRNGLISEKTAAIFRSIIDQFTGKWTCGQTFLDLRDGKVYRTVKLGDQCWMAENLAYLPSVSPAYEGSVTDPHFYP